VSGRKLAAIVEPHESSKFNVLSIHPVKYRFLFDQAKSRKSGLILKALQGRLWTPFLITSVV
jgi:hypothetical protein